MLKKKKMTHIDGMYNRYRSNCIFGKLFAGQSTTEKHNQPHSSPYLLGKYFSFLTEEILFHTQFKNKF